MGSIRNPRQDLVIPVLNRFLMSTQFNNDLLLNKGGICAALSAEYLIAKRVTGKLKNFFEKLSKITQLKRNQFKNNEEWLAHYCQESIWAFKADLFDNTIQQGDIHAIFQRYPNIYPTFKMGLDLKTDKAKDFFDDVLADNEMVFLGGWKKIKGEKDFAHAIAIFKKDDDYCTYDPNTGVELKFKNIKELSDEILASLAVEKDDKYIQIAIKSFAYKTINPSAKNRDTKILLDNYSIHEKKYGSELINAARINDLATLEYILSNKETDVKEQISTFYIACQLGYSEIIAKVKHKLGNNLSSSEWHQGLLHALKNRRQNIVDILLDLKLDENNYSSCISDSIDINNLFIAACEGGDISLIKKIQERFSLDVIDNETLNKAIHYAISGHAKQETINYLIRISTDIITRENIEKFIKYTVQHGHDSCFKYFVQESKKFDLINSNMVYQSILSFAIKHKRYYMINELLNTDSVSVSIEHINEALKNKDMKFILLLLDDSKKFASNDKDSLKTLKKIISGKDRRHHEIEKKYPKLLPNLLLTACVNGNKELADRLVEMDINLIPTLSDESFDCLIEACINYDIESLQLLLSKGININKKINDGPYKGKTAIEIVIEKDNDDVRSKMIDLFLHKNLNIDTLSITNKRRLLFDLASKGQVDSINKLFNFSNNQPELQKLMSKKAFSTNLVEAVKTNNLTAMQGFLSIVPKLPTDLQNECLLIACTNGYDHLISIFSHPKERINNIKAYECFMVAYANQHTNVFEKLLKYIPDKFPDKFEDSNINILKKACEDHRPNIVNNLLGHKITFKTDIDEIKLIYNAYQMPIPKEKPLEYLLNLAHLFNHDHILNLVAKETNINIQNFKKPSLQYTLFCGLRKNKYLYPYDSFFKDACREGNLCIIKQLIEVKKIDISYQLYSYALEQRNAEIFDYLNTTITEKQAFKIVSDAIKKKDFNTVNVLINKINKTELKIKLLESAIKHNEYKSAIIILDKMDERTLQMFGSKLDANAKQNIIEYARQVNLPHIIDKLNKIKITSCEPDIFLYRSPLRHF